MKISIKHKYTGNILFEHNCENNTLKLTLEIGVKKGADLRGANLWRADLGRAYLGGANLRGADLWGANLRGANLRGAYLRRADLGEADLEGANFRGANLEGANLRGVNLGGADLEGANLEGADLRGANLAVKNPPLLDHTFISEILYREAKTESQKDFAARILKETHKCWKDFYKLAKQKQVIKWAKEVLSQWKEYSDKIKDLEL